LRRHKTLFARIKQASFSQDLVAGLTGAVAGAPQAMGFALIAGVSPVYGLYAAVVANIVGTLTASSTFMTIAPTNALSLVVFSTLYGSGSPKPIEALFALTLLVGVFQLAAGLLRFGSLVRFVSNAVMTGFIAGAGTLIILGQLSNFTGYQRSDDISGALPQFWDWLVHPGSWNTETLILGLVALGTILLLRRLHMKNISTLIGIVLSSLLALLLGWESVRTVGDISAIPQGFPMPVIPDLSYAPDLAAAALAMAVLSMVQSAGITQTVPQPDGSTADINRDFIGQGLSNLAGSLFRGMPSAGSLSRTAVNISAGAETRLANLSAGVFIGLVLVAFGAAIERVILASLAAQLILAALSLFNVEHLKEVWRISWTARLTMLATYVSTLVLPLEYSIYVGVVLSLLMYVYTSSQNIELVALEPIDEHRYRRVATPRQLSDRTPLILSVHGNLYFAAVKRLETLLPSARGVDKPVVILRLRHNQYLGSTGVALLRRYANELEAQGGKLMLSGVEPEIHEQLVRCGFIDELGPENIIDARDTIFDATSQAHNEAQQFLTRSDTAEEPGQEPIHSR
jgi:SulP family sulfate permease